MQGFPSLRGGLIVGPRDIWTKVITDCRSNPVSGNRANRASNLLALGYIPGVPLPDEAGGN